MSEKCAHFKLSNFVRTGEVYHFARTELRAENPVEYHDHDYHELFWATRGSGEQCWNGSDLPLLAHTLYLVRPQDRHRVAGALENPMRAMNLAFPSKVWRDLSARYFADEPDWFEQSEDQRVWPMEPAGMAVLSYWEERLLAKGRLRIVLDGFLMELMRLHEMSRGKSNEPIPDWLVSSRREIAKPGNFAGGTQSFARLAGRSPAHVARAAVRWLGMTPTEIVNAARLEFSAEQLAETDRPIIDIILECGLTNVSHFYALFRKRFGMSPRRYRLHAHRTVRG